MVTETRRIAVIFPGQGSQTIGMMNELAQSFDVVQQTFAEASDALGFDLWQITADEERLHKTE